MMFAHAIACWIGAILMHSPAGRGATYSVVTLGIKPATLYGRTIEPDYASAAINKLGHVAFIQQGNYRTRHILLYRNGELEDLGDFESPAVKGINDRDDVLIQEEEMSHVVHSRLWRTGIWTECAPVAGFKSSSALHLTDAGVVLGYCHIYEQLGRVGNAVRGRSNAAFVTWSNGIPTQLLDWPGTFSNNLVNITAANSQGHFAGDFGYEHASPAPWHYKRQGWIMRDDKLIPMGKPSMPQLDGWVRSTAFNNKDQATCVYDLGGEPKLKRSQDDAPAFFFNGSEYIALGLLPECSRAYPFALNNRGQVVGSVSRQSVGGASKSDRTAFLWQNGMMSDLNTLTSGGSQRNLTSAIALNDLGQIVAIGNVRGVPRYFLLTPK